MGVNQIITNEDRAMNIKEFNTKYYRVEDENGQHIGIIGIEDGTWKFMYEPRDDDGDETVASWMSPEVIEGIGDKLQDLNWEDDQTVGVDEDDENGEDGGDEDDGETIYDELKRLRAIIEGDQQKEVLKFPGAGVNKQQYPFQEAVVDPDEDDWDRSAAEHEDDKMRAKLREPEGTPRSAEEKKEALNQLRSEAIAHRLMDSA